MIHKTIAIEIKEQTENGGKIIISTGDLDRDRDRVKPSGANVTNYLNNPVVQFAHNYSEPWATIGKTVNLEIKPEGLVADFELRPPANEQDPQNIVRLLWEGGWIRTASIGFNPTSAVENEEGGRNFEEWDLLEWSLVPVPANQAALRLTAKAFTDTSAPALCTDKQSTDDIEPTAAKPASPQADDIQPEGLDAEVIESLREYLNELTKQIGVENE